MDPESDWLLEILQNIQLEQFYTAIRDQLQITRLAHFDYVHTEDLEKIGISKPGIRRLLDAVRKRKLQQWNRKFWSKLFGSSSASSTSIKTDSLSRQNSSEPATTCIILEKDIVLLNQLGTGSFGVVRKGEWKISEQGKGIQVAVKVLKADAFSQPGVYDDFRREVEAMHSLKHPNLIKLHGVVFHPLMMVCELAPMGALIDYIRGQNGKVSLNLIWTWSEQVASGMAHLEKHRFLHRDLACRNILLSTLELVKIGDFGLMRALPAAHDCYVMSERRRVPFPWCAPESLRSRQFSHAADVWMFAVALWEMYTFGEEPWMGLNGSEILRLIMREGQRLAAPAACPPDVYMLMMQCWDLQPKERPTFAGIQRYLETNQLESAVAALSYHKPGQLSLQAGDAVVLVDRRPELHWWKGQNQRTLEVGLFPSTLVTAPRGRGLQPARKAHTLSPVAARLGLSQSPKGAKEAVQLRKRRTIESTQAPTTRGGNHGPRHFNYNKLVNDRAVRDMHSRSLNQVREDLLIDLELPPAPRAPRPPGPVSLLDEPIDVPQAGFQDAWGGASSEPESLPTPSPAARPPGVAAARSLENLTSAFSAHDPFDTSHWPIDPVATAAAAPQWEHEPAAAQSSAAPPPWLSPATPVQLNNETRRYSSLPPSQQQAYASCSNVYGNTQSKLNNGTSAQSTEYGNRQEVVASQDPGVVATPLAEMSLDDRISESLNLRKNSESVHSNSSIYNGGSSATNQTQSRYSESCLPTYGNFEMNPTQQQFLLETRDFYSKLSTETRPNSDYEKNTYVPKSKGENEKLRHFSDAIKESKNYSAVKEANGDYGHVGWSEEPSTSRPGADYDEVLDTASSFYSEVGEPAYGNVRLYDEVYEASAPRPHRPAPPCPTQPR